MLGREVFDVRVFFPLINKKNNKSYNTEGKAGGIDAQVPEFFTGVVDHLGIIFLDDRLNHNGGVEEEHDENRCDEAISTSCESLFFNILVAYKADNSNEVEVICVGLERIQFIGGIP